MGLNPFNKVKIKVDSTLHENIIFDLPFFFPNDLWKYTEGIQLIVYGCLYGMGCILLQTQHFGFVRHDVWSL